MYKYIYNLIYKYKIYYIHIWKPPLYLNPKKVKKQ